MKSVFSFVLFSALVSSAQAEGVKVGVLNIPRALQETAAGKAAKAQLEKDVAGKKKSVEDEQAKIVKLQDEFQKKAAVMNEKTRQEKGQELQKKMMALQEMAQRSQAELQQREGELTKPIVDGLRALIPEVGRRRKLDVVLDQSAVLYALDITDVTEELIAAYDEKYPVKKK